MFHFFEAITNIRGDSLVGYQVVLKTPGTGATVPIFADQNGTPIVAVSGIANVCLTDSAGNADLYVPFGEYDVAVYSPEGTLFKTVLRVPMNGGAKGDKGDSGDDGAPGGNPDARIVYARLADNVAMDGVTDDSAGIQAILDTPRPNGAPLEVVFTGSYVAAGLAVSSNTRIRHLPGVKAIRTPGSRKPMWRNKNPVAPLQADTVDQAYARIVDENIEFIGGIFDGTQASEPNIRAADGSLLATIALYGVRNGKVLVDRMVDPACYFTHFALCENFDVGGFRLDCPIRADGTGTGATHYNQDGVHLNGPCRNFYIHDVSGRSADDFIALTADDGPGNMFAQPYIGPYVRQGPITNVVIERISLSSALYGIRLLSKTSRIDKVTIRDLTGTTYGRGFYVDAYKEAGGPGNGDVGKVVVENMKVQALDYTSGDPNNPDRPTEKRMINIGCKVEEIVFRDCTRVTSPNVAKTHYQWLDIDGNSVIDSLSIENLRIHDRGTEDLRSEGVVRALPGATCRTISFDGVDWQRDQTVPATGSLLDYQGGVVGILRANNIRANRTTNLFKMRLGVDFSVAQLTNIYSYEPAPYTIDESQYANPNAPTAPSGILYINASYPPEVSMYACAGSPSLVGPTALQARVRNVDDEWITFKGNVVVGKSASVSGVTRNDVGAYRIAFLVPMSLSSVHVEGYGDGAAPLPYPGTASFASATYCDIQTYTSAYAPADAPIVSVVFKRGNGG